MHECFAEVDVRTLRYQFGWRLFAALAENFIRRAYRARGIFPTQNAPREKARRTRAEYPRASAAHVCKTLLWPTKSEARKTAREKTFARHSEMHFASRIPMN